MLILIVLLNIFLSIINGVNAVENDHMFLMWTSGFNAAVAVAIFLQWLSNK